MTPTMPSSLGSRTRHTIDDSRWPILLGRLFDRARELVPDETAALRIEQSLPIQVLAKQVIAPLMTPACHCNDVCSLTVS
jgi:hypothetical protein